MKYRSTNSEYIEEKRKHIWTKHCSTKLWGWDKCILMFAGLLLHIWTTKIFFFFWGNKSHEKEKKLSSLIRDHYLLDSFSHVSTFSLFTLTPLSTCQRTKFRNWNQLVFRLSNFRILPASMVKIKKKTCSVGNWIKDEGMPEVLFCLSVFGPWPVYFSHFRSSEARFDEGSLNESSLKKIRN